MGAAIAVFGGRRAVWAAGALAALGVLGLLALLAILVGLLGQLSASTSSGATDGIAPVGSGIPAVYVPMYKAAAGQYGINWYLLASVHRQESTFSTSTWRGVRSATNAYGAAGPMQIGVGGLAGDSWSSVQDAYLPIGDQRPTRYPMQSAGHPSVYDDFDAIAAAALYLRNAGADSSLTSDGTYRAVCAYIGTCTAANTCTGPNAYCQVLPRAEEWEQQGKAAIEMPTLPREIATTPGSTARILPNGIAVAPEEAPPEVKAMIAAGNEIITKPYPVPDRHYPTHLSNPDYDCSSATSHVLWGGGRFGIAPWASGEFEHFGAPGSGEWVTTYANNGHVFIEVAGIYFNTAHYGFVAPPGPGPRWSATKQTTSEYRYFVVRHPEGL